MKVLGFCSYGVSKKNVDVIKLEIKNGGINSILVFSGIMLPPLSWNVWDTVNK